VIVADEEPKPQKSFLFWYVSVEELNYFILSLKGDHEPVLWYLHLSAFLRGFRPAVVV